MARKLIFFPTNGLRPCLPSSMPISYMTIVTKNQLSCVLNVSSPLKNISLLSTSSFSFSKIMRTRQDEEHTDSSNSAVSAAVEDTEFVNRKDQIFKLTDREKSRSQASRRRRHPLATPPLAPRGRRLPVDGGTWPDVWPAAHTFKASVVPFPVRQGFTEGGAPPPEKYANLELMKVPNFLHLTPPAVQRHCRALRRFCTRWPEALDSAEACDANFPVEVSYSDYCFSGASVRHSDARRVTLRVRVDRLPGLDARARDKLLRLVGKRYDPRTDILTLEADRCPLRAQNLAYARYLLTALYFESRRRQPWEADKSKEDWESYVWEQHASYAESIGVARRVARAEQAGDTARQVMDTPDEARGSPDDGGLTDDGGESREAVAPDYARRVAPEAADSEWAEVPEVRAYGRAVEALHNEGESEESVRAYGEAVRALLGLDKAKLGTN